MHFKCNADTPKWGTKKVTHWQIKESLIQCTDLKLAQIIPDAVPTSNVTNLILNYTIKFEQPNENDNNKHNPHAQLPLLNWHNQNPNITTVQMLMVLLQWLCGEVWESEFSYVWQQWIMLARL